MKKTFYLFVILFSLGTYTYAQRIETSSNSITVYTDNGAYVKAKSSNSNTMQVKFNYTEESINNQGDTIRMEYSYSFSINPNEEKQLFYTSNKIIALGSMTCENEDESYQATETKSIELKAYY